MGGSRTKVVVLALAFALLLGWKSPVPQPVALGYPKTWPLPLYDLAKSPLTKEGIALGRKLFYDPILSADSTVACSNCHLSYTAFTHVDHALSHGIRDSIGTRNSPALMNLAWGRAFMWDGAVNHLDMQALAPINHAAEMGGNTAHVVAKLNRSPIYPALFKLAYGDAAITGERMLKALAQFQLTLISCNAKYDRVMAGSEAFTAQEEQGLRLFRQHCASCHAEPLFTTGGFANNGLPMDTLLMDLGRMGVSQRPDDSLLFKVPTLRNVEFSFPYMHDGRFRTLREVMGHYASGITPSATLAPELRAGLALTANERTDIIAFLLTLTDKEFLFNPDHAFPRN